MLLGCSDRESDPTGVVGVSFQQLWPRTADGQTSPHTHVTGLLFLPGDRGLLLWEKAGRVAHYRMQGDDLELLGELRLEDVLSTRTRGRCSATRTATARTATTIPLKR